ncbi:hypothetical protein MRY87_11765 [bacterium]|nr:hypothetical protein [bacterium]
MAGRSFSILLLTALLFAAPLAAQVECSSQVSYRWEYTPESSVPALEPPRGKKMKAQKGSEQESQVPEKSTFEVLHVTRRVRAASEEEGIQRMRSLLDRDISMAGRVCREKHENLALCISSKFVAMGSALRQLSFRARKELEESISADCKAVTGRCMPPEATKVECTPVVLPQGGADDAEAAPSE